MFYTEERFTQTVGIRILAKSNSGMFQTGRAVKWYGFRIVLDAIFIVGPLVQFFMFLALTVSYINCMYF